MLQGPVQIQGQIAAGRRARIRATPTLLVRHGTTTTPIVGAVSYGILSRYLERLLEELRFEAPDMKMGRVEINKAYVTERLEELSREEDLSKFIL